MGEDAPPPPEIGRHILVGLNSVTRHLEALAARTAPPTVAGAPSNPGEKAKSSNEAPESETAQKQEAQHGHGDPENSSKEKDLRPLSMVLLTHPKPTLSPAHAHIPTLIHLSNLPQHSSPSVPSQPPPSLDSATRLVPLPTSTDGRLASQLHIPRVGALAIFEDAPGAKALEQYVREHVGVTECEWIGEALKAEWRGVNVKGEISGGKK